MNGSCESEELSTSLIEKDKCQDTGCANSEDSDEEKVTTKREDNKLCAYPCFNIDSLSPTSDNQSANKNRRSSARPLELERTFLVAS